MNQTNIQILLLFFVSTYATSKEMNGIRNFVKWMQRDCDPKLCNNMILLNSMQAVNYQSGNQTWILLKGCGGLPDSMLEFSNAMGLLYFTEPVVMNAEVQGTFIYPDWVTCVKGTWKNFTLQNGSYCKITKHSDHSGKRLSIMTEKLASSPKLRYLPPNYHHYGLPQTQTDPFEQNTVEVRSTDIKDIDTSADQGEGLFVTRDIKRGELISYYSGRMVIQSGPHSLHRRKISDAEMWYQNKFALRVSTGTSKHVVIDIPPRYGKLATYKTSLGHKANHHFHFNAEFHPLHFHPVLGFIMSVVAVKDITKGSEVFGNYGYTLNAYQRSGILPKDIQCYLGKCQDVPSLTMNDFRLRPPNSITCK